ncbi:MAG TPA: hypothetical protein VKB59_05765 [Micromonosporaceae bacterium]|nr:hypothetical protein [Micromonosporaceae bacterium]
MIIGWAANDFGDDLGDGVAGPIGLLIIVLLVIGTVLLMRSMNKHLKRIPEKWPEDAARTPASTSRRETEPDGSADATPSGAAATDDVPLSRAADGLDDEAGKRAGDAGAVDADR